MTELRLRLSVCAFFCLSQSSFANQPAHEHNGSLTPYVGEPEVVVLSDKEDKRLLKGKAIFKNQIIKKEKRAVAIFQVKAKPATVWSVIKDFKNYPAWIEDVKNTEVYKQEQGHLYVRFDAENRYAGKSTWFAKHNYPVDNREWGTWVLDYDFPSDLDDSVGYWRVTPHPDNAEESTVTYSASLKLKQKVPAFILRLIIKSRLKQATHWVKKQAESR
jgi:ribosome-associated toxin RatA of RatAB toxin-antitoxin module